jgi:uncharacterized protein YktA (UPF0223 family)
MNDRTLPWHTDWTADEIHLLLSFLNEISEKLWDIYGEDIIELRHQEATQRMDQSQANLSHVD